MAEIAALLETTQAKGATDVAQHLWQVPQWPFQQPARCFQEKCETVFSPDMRKNKELERFSVSVKR
ncbi:hypothetical protein NAC44_16620 [Allorhizobium sp. BGMRC 0089]|nr:hypothetical protein [Allorhizobium sonneratiae]